MWYVIQTFGGQEEKTADMIKRMVASDLFQDCFVLKRERLKKFQGSWNKVEEVLFHGYAFVISETPEELYEELKRVPRLTKVLGREMDYFFALGEEEKRLVEHIGGREHKAALSRVAVEEGKRVYVIQGPLKGYEGDILKVNLHKREVVMGVEFMGRKVELRMGVDMVDDRKFCCQ